MHNTLNEKISEYKLVTGKDFNHLSYPNPSVVPPNLIKLVASIKTLSASVRQLDIMSEVRSAQKVGDAFVTDEDSIELMNDAEQEIAIWTPYL